jgi:ribosome-associated protein
MGKKLKHTPTELLVDIIVNGMQEVKAKDIVVLDMKDVRSAITDFFVICHGTSNTHVEAISRSVEKETIEKLTEKPAHVEGVQNAQWILMDYFSVVVHIFDEKSREYYRLEDLWADANMRFIKESA